MRSKQLGHTSLTVSEIGFGAWGIGGGWGIQDDRQAIEAIRRAYELGVTFFDSAYAYGDGHSEKLIHQALADVRQSVVISSKVPPKNFRWPVTTADPIEETFPEDWIIACTERSLKNLGTDCLDLQQLHAWTDAYTHQDSWKSAAQKLKAQGKIKAFGVSANDWDPYGAVGLVESGLIDSVQLIYNIFEQRPAERLLPAALTHHVGIIVRVPFEEGLLTGKLGPDHLFDADDWRKDWLTRDRLIEANSRVESLKSLLTPETPTLPDLALKFCLAHPAVSTVIPGMRRISNVEANCKVSGSTPLTDIELAELKKHSFVHGWAYPWSAAV